LQLGNIVPGIRLRVPRDRVIIEYAYDLGHFFLQSTIKERSALLK
jgi:hypothetical protein